VLAAVAPERAWISESQTTQFVNCVLLLLQAE
jgi:hypothetical protein